MSEYAKEYRLEDLTLVIDSHNADAPFMVYLEKGGLKFSATYEFAVDSGMLEINDEYYNLTQRQCDWLELNRELVEEIDAEFYIKDEED